jgi:hypothetical protein
MVVGDHHLALGAEHAVDSTPRITPGLRSTPVPGICVPGGANTPTSPVRALGAPQTTCTSSEGPGPFGQVSTRQSRSGRRWGAGPPRSRGRWEGAERLGGVLDALDLEAQIGQRLGDLSTLASVSRCSPSQLSVNFMEVRFLPGFAPAF